MRVNREKAVVGQKNVVGVVAAAGIGGNFVFSQNGAFGVEGNAERFNLFKFDAAMFRAFVNVAFQSGFFLAGVAEVQRRDDRKRMPVFAETGVEGFRQLGRNHAQAAPFHECCGFGTYHPGADFIDFGPEIFAETLLFGEVLNF